MSLRPPREDELYSLLYSKCLDYGNIHPANWSYKWDFSRGAAELINDEWMLNRIAVGTIAKNKLIAPVRFILPAKTGSRTSVHILDRAGIYYFAGGGMEKEHNTHAGLSGPDGSFKLSSDQEQIGPIRVGVFRDPIEWYVSWHWFQFHKFRHPKWHRESAGGYSHKPHFAKGWNDFKKWLFSHELYPDCGSVAKYKGSWNDVVSPIRGNFYNDGNLGVDIVVFTERLSEGLEIFIKEWHCLLNDPRLRTKSNYFKVEDELKTIKEIIQDDSFNFQHRKNSSLRSWNDAEVWSDNELAALKEIYAEFLSFFHYDSDGDPKYPILINPGRNAKLSSLVVRNDEKWNEILKKHDIR